MNNPDEDAATDENSPGFWKSLGDGLVQTFQNTGKVLKHAYEAGDENKHFIVPAINGIVGHRLAEANDRNAIPMSFRSNEKDTGPAEVLSDVSNPSSVVVFVHGLMADEVAWQTAMPGKTGYGPQLEQLPGVTCLYLRYNSGRHISQNGRELNDLLSQLVKENKSKVKNLILIGHSMGGLVVRSAGHYGRKDRAGWIKKLTDIVLIGVPNDGSFLERFGHIATFVLKTIWNYPTRIVGRIADERSDGIKDLRWGFMTDEDWKHEDSDKLMNVKRTEVPPLPGVNYHVLLASMTESVISPLAVYFGDGLVGTHSAAGKEFVEFTQAAVEKSGWLDRLPGRPAKPTVHYEAFMTTGHLGLLGSQDLCEYLKTSVVKS